MYYTVIMTKTITVRAERKMWDALRNRARRRRVSVSEVVRQILDDALTERPLNERASGLAGSLSVADSADAWRKQIRERNWRS